MQIRQVLLTLLLGVLGGMFAQVVLKLLPPEGTLGGKVPGGAIVTAREFRLISKDGKPRGIITVLPNDSAVLSLKAKNGRSEAVMSMSEAGTPSLSFYDEKGVLRTLVSILPEVGPCIRLFHTDTSPRAWLNVSDKGVPLIGICDKQAQSGAALQLSNTDKPACILRTNGAMRAILCVSDIGPSLNLLDGDARLRAVMGQTSIQNKNTRKITEASSVTLFDQTGKILWCAPHSADTSSLGPSPDPTPFQLPLHK